MENIDSLEQAYKKLRRICSPDYETQKEANFLALALHEAGINLNEEDRENFYTDIIHQLKRPKAIEVREHLYNEWFKERCKKELTTIIEGSANYYKERKAKSN